MLVNQMHRITNNNENNNQIQGQFDLIARKHYQEWLSSTVDAGIIRLNVKSLSGDAAYEYLLYGLQNNARRNDGRLRDGYLKRYRHVEQGGWWCNGVDILIPDTDTKWGCFKPNKPCTDSKKNKPIKYEHPPNVATEVFALKVPQHVWEKIAERCGIPIGEATNFWQWVIDNPSVPLIPTEGAKKQLHCLQQAMPRSLHRVLAPGIDSLKILLETAQERNTSSPS